jgi:hypothetical protein
MVLPQHQDDACPGATTKSPLTQLVAPGQFAPVLFDYRSRPHPPYTPPDRVCAVFCFLILTSRLTSPFISSGSAGRIRTFFEMLYTTDYENLLMEREWDSRRP